MKRVIIESPYAGNREANVAYARRCMADSLARNEAPFLSHLLYPQVLDDDDPHDREQGIAAGLAWGAMAEIVAVYTDRGISRGMAYGIDVAKACGRPIEFRTIGE